MLTVNHVSSLVSGKSDRTRTASIQSLNNRLRVHIESQSHHKMVLQNTSSSRVHLLCACVCAGVMWCSVVTAWKHRTSLTYNRWFYSPQKTTGQIRFTRGRPLPRQAKNWITFILCTSLLSLYRPPLPLFIPFFPAMFLSLSLSLSLFCRSLSPLPPSPSLLRSFSLLWFSRAELSLLVLRPATRLNTSW